MLSHYFRGEITAALDVGARAYSINPNDTELAGEYGFRLALSGQWKPGCKLVASAVSRNPQPSGYFEFALAVCAYIDKDYITAERWARLADVRANPIYHLILTAILGQLGKTEEVRSERQWLAVHAPTFVDNIRHEVAVRIIRREDQLHLLDGFKKAGLSIPTSDPLGRASPRSQTYLRALYVYYTMLRVLPGSADYTFLVEMVLTRSCCE